MNGNFDEKQYLQYVIKKVEERRNQSAYCFSKTDLYDEEGKIYIIKWFDIILEKIREKPPKGKISNIIVFDNVDLNEIQIDYAYSADEENAATDFEILIE